MGCNGDTMFMAKHSAFSPYRLYRRETGFGVPIGAGDALAKSLYCGMKPIASWDYECANALPTGGVFNLEFSPEGSLLVAACEKKSIQIFDPLTHQRIHTVNGAHSDCVNCVKFLDGRMFATCSDDTTIALWDVRNLKKKIRSLLGHSNWVKNIEFSVKDKLLVTSGLDGSIYTWDINSYTECNLVYQRVFHASGLMRCRLSPDAKQMVMCTTGGLIVIIHDLNLATLAKDLHGFKPNLYRLMQMSLQVIPIASMYEHLFDANRTENRVEFISDFPERNDAEVVSALQVHPQGWCALSRNISHDDRSEWSCIHDIQPLEDEPEKSVQDTAPPELRKPLRRVMLRRRPLYVYTEGVLSRRHERPSTSRATPREEPPAPDPAARQPPVGLSNDVWEASITIKQHRMLQEMYSRGQVGRNFNMQRIMGINTGISPPATHAVRHNSRIVERPPRQSSASSSTSSSSSTSALSSPQSSSATPSASSSLEWSSSLECGSRWKEVMQPRIRQNRQRLLYYVQETNEGKGFIKELCFSADGRVVCSPFGRGVRFLTLDESCRELPQLASGVDPATINPQPLHEAGQSLGVHQDLVVSTKFSPRYHLLVTGCLEGKIVWYQPYSGESLY